MEGKECEQHGRMLGRIVWTQASGWPGVGSEECIEVMNLSMFATPIVKRKSPGKYRCHGQKIGKHGYMAALLSDETS